MVCANSGVGIIYQRWILQLWSVPQWGWHHLSKMDSTVMVCAAVGLASFIKDGFYSYGLCPVGLASFIKDGFYSYGLCPVGLASFIKDGFYSYGLCRSGVGIIYQRWIGQLWSVPQWGWHHLSKMDSTVMVCAQWGWHHLSKMDSTVMVCAPVGLASFIKDGFYSYGLCPSGVGIIYQRWILQLWSVPSGVGIVHQRWIVRLWSVQQRGWHRSSKTKLLCEDGTSCDGMRGKRWGGRGSGAERTGSVSLSLAGGGGGGQNRCCKITMSHQCFTWDIKSNGVFFVEFILNISGVKHAVRLVPGQHVFIGACLARL